MGKHDFDVMVWELNRNIAESYPEIKIAYASMQKAWKEGNYGRFMRLMLIAQPKCWWLVKSRNIGDLSYVFLRDVLAGEDESLISEYVEGGGFYDNPFWNFMLKISKGRIDPKADKEAVEVVRRLKEDGVPQVIYTSTTEPIARAFLEKEGILELFQEVAANKLYSEGGKIIDHVHWFDGSRGRSKFEIDPKDKGRTLKRILREKGIFPDKVRVGYVAASDEDEGAIGDAYHGIVAPRASESMRNKYRGSKKIHVIDRYSDILKI
jgi:phosphoserine phosphatase